MKYGYIRVSSDKQTVENQRFEIEQFCLREGVQIDGWIEETVSGMIMEILSYCMRDVRCGRLKMLTKRSLK